jgi:trehalose 6-phosphate phosphatase
VLDGRKSCEFRPPVAVDKGSAFSDVVREVAPDGALFAGDDRGDLSVFDALDGLVGDGTIDHAVRVGVRSDEAPEEILSRADVVVDGPPGVAALLSSLAQP